ncbi:hypothetical protein [Flexivirga caeni]|uniref:Uncharacterized protein n=1 Tax=Flexivirga caeni TaxID=2294115 RepID=A0A3M9MBI0_9MICO|nr:hypothetical protein [Flexivirga caeni]RNI22213.1 hypothetical protein EFY87_09565 [Flexivirga caeni]
MNTETGPHVPTVVRGVIVLVLAAVAVVWRLADRPDWTVVGIALALAVGVVFLAAAGVSFLIRRTRRADIH